MAAFLDEEQVLQMVLLSDEDDNENCEPDNDRILREKLVRLLESFDGGPEFNHSFFRDTAVGLLMPLVQLSYREVRAAADLQALRLLSANFSSLPILRKESKHWLEAIHRRLAGRNRFRNPFYAEIRRDIPSEIFGLVVRVVNNVSVKEFCPPLCFHAKNKKGEVISFTTIQSVAKLLCLLSGLSLKAVKKYLKRSLGGGRKKGHKFKVLVTDTKDIAFVYKFSKQQLTIGYHYGEWNSYGFPQHN